jgi:hypothetical protein
VRFNIQPTNPGEVVTRRRLYEVSVIVQASYQKAAHQTSKEPPHTGEGAQWKDFAYSAVVYWRIIRSVGAKAIGWSERAVGEDAPDKYNPYRARSLDFTIFLSLDVRNCCQLLIAIRGRKPARPIACDFSRGFLCKGLLNHLVAGFSGTRQREPWIEFIIAVFVEPGALYIEQPEARYETRQRKRVSG